MPSIVSSEPAQPQPAHPHASKLLCRVQSWCSPNHVRDVQMTGDRVALPWRVVHAIESARNVGLGALVSELRIYGHVLADDHGLTVIATAG